MGVQGLLRAKGPGAATFAAAGAAGAASATLLYPLEVVRSRLTINPGRYAGPRAALRQIAATEGTAALYRGLPASVASIIPEAAITYGMRPDAHWHICTDAFGSSVKD